MRARPFAILCVSVVLPVAACLYAVCPDVLPLPAAAWVDDILQLTASALAVIGFAWTTYRARGSDRRWHRWMLSSSVSLLVGLLAWMGSQVVVGVSLPATTLASLGFIMAAALMLPAVLAMAYDEPDNDDDTPVVSQRNPMLLVLDGLILIGSITILVLATVHEQIARSLAQSGPSFTTIVAHPAIYLVVMVLVVILARTRQAARQPAMWLLFGVALAQSASAWVFAYLVATGAPDIPPVADLGFMVGPVLLALAPLAPPARRQTASVRDRRLNPAAYLHLLVPFLPMVITGVFVAVGTATGIVPTPLEIYLGFVVIATVMARQLLTSSENVRLLRGLRDSQAELEHQATHDAVTGLANRAAFHNRLANADGALVLLFIDVDDFKSVNDRFGHAVGDAVLHALGQRLSGCVREQDLVARLGGDEFGVLINAPVNADEVGKRVLATLSQPYRVSEEPLTVRVSIGLATRSESDVSGDLLLGQADVAMYTAKRSGKGTLVIG